MKVRLVVISESRSGKEEQETIEGTVRLVRDDPREIVVEPAERIVIMREKPTRLLMPHGFTARPNDPRKIIFFPLDDNTKGKN